MKELIPISEHNGQKAVSARLLHEFLESKRDFSNWIKDRIEKYGLIENVDYQAFANFVECQNGVGGSKRIEYALTIDAAKELSMVEGNDKGKQARRYFIECEKKAKIPQSFAEALMLAAKQAEENERLMIENKQKDRIIEEAAPKVDWHDKNQKSAGSHTMTTCVEKLSICLDYMNKVLMRYKIIRKTGGEYSFLSKYQNKGFGEQVAISAGTHSDGTQRTKLDLRYFEKGRKLIHDAFRHAQKDGFIVQRKDGRWILSKEYGYTEFKNL